MQPDRVIKRLEALSEISKQGKRINGLFRLMMSPELWLQAYANIYANKGATTRGVDSVTMDGFSEERVANIIGLLREGRYRFKPVRRAYRHVEASDDSNEEENDNTLRRMSSPAPCGYAARLEIPKSVKWRAGFIKR